MNNVKTRTFHAFNDPGHGWLRVRRDFIHRLGIADKITEYSYQRNEYVFLEEDCDATLFLHTLTQNNIPYALKHHSTNRNSKIRSYDHYRQTA